MHFLQKITSFIAEKHLLSPGNKPIIAVSGGADSIAMLHVLSKAGYSGYIAHCNFQLRGSESDGDEQFVQKLADKYKLPFFVKHFDTKSYAKHYKLSFEMAARDLRYNWFTELHEYLGADGVAIAHHQDDAVETFHINLLRGTGIRGIKGINAQSGIYFRPLLSVSREEILNYCRQQELFFREDSTNASTHIMRNKIRHEIIPRFKEIQENYTGIMNENFQRFAMAEHILQNHISELFNTLSHEENGIIRIPIQKLLDLHPLEGYLYEFFAPYNFGLSTIKQLEHSLIYKTPGKQFFSENHRIVKDREEILLTEIPANSDEKYTLHKTDTQITITDPFGETYTLTQSVIPAESITNFANQDYKTAYLNWDKIHYPLVIRHKRNGDYFYPLGMKGKKKLKTYFIDKKFSLPEKERLWVITSESRIIWLAGNIPDDRFKVTSSTDWILKLQLTVSS